AHRSSRFARRSFSSRLRAAPCPTYRPAAVGPMSWCKSPPPAEEKKCKGRSISWGPSWHRGAIEASAHAARSACLSLNYLLLFRMPERIQKPPVPWGPKQGDGDGPRSPDISRPDTRDLLKKMRKVDPNQSKRYRQRTAE